MKLISFAALSFLAITVSAWPPNNHDAKDAEQHQSDRDQSAPQPLGIRAPMLHNYYQQFLQTELEKLHKEHQEKKGLLDDMKDVVKVMEQELNVLGGEISKCVEGLKKEELLTKYWKDSENVDGTHKSINDLQVEVEKIMEKYTAKVEEMTSLYE